MRALSIEGREIGPGHPCWIIAEAGANADNDPARARDLVAAAAMAGADAVKFQTYTASKISTRTAPLYWQGAERSQWECFERLDKLPLETLARLVQDSTIPVFSTPFDLQAVDELDAMGVACFKVASADITYHALIRRIAQKGKPVLLSTGAASLEDVVEAVDVCLAEGNDRLALMQCTLKYPCPPHAIHLRMMEGLRRRFSYPVGLSDHSIGSAIPVGAAALGANLLEKHFTLDKSAKGSPDHAISADPVDLAEIVRGVRAVEAALGKAAKEPVAEEVQAQMYARRSVTTTRSIGVGEIIKASDLTCKRPATGIGAKLLDSVVGLTAKRDLPEDTTLGWGDVQ
jgi:sialic acid synthase SpsE